jgi:threonine/homoserine/homoserine lactone efflux protein
MPIDPSLFALFLAAVLVICVTPGPDMAYVLAHALSQGSLAGVVASLGMAIGMVVHTMAAALGLATLLQAAPVAYDVIRYVGAGYLVFMGIQAWRATPHSHDAERQPVVALHVVLWRAAATNILNPKIVLFYVAFLPQFVDSQRGNATAQFLILGLVFVILGLIVDSAIAVLGGYASKWLQRRNPQRILNRVAATIFFGLAARLIVP